MFGLNKKVWTKQLKRAATIENSLLSGIFDHLMAAGGFDAAEHEPNDQDLAVIAGTAHWILGIGIQKQVAMFGDVEIATERIKSCARELLLSDEQLEKLTVRLLYEIVSLSMMLKGDKWSQDFAGMHIRSMEILNAARPKWPELFHDVNESIFKELFGGCTHRYMPDMRSASEDLFG